MQHIGSIVRAMLIATEAKICSVTLLPSAVFVVVFHKQHMMHLAKIVARSIVRITINVRWTTNVITDFARNSVKLTHTVAGRIYLILNYTLPFLNNVICSTTPKIYNRYDATYEIATWVVLGVIVAFVSVMLLTCLVKQCKRIRCKRVWVLLIVMYM